MNGDTCRYELHGLRILSEIHLHEPKVEGNGHDLEVSWGEDARGTDSLPGSGEIVAEMLRGGSRLYTIVRDGRAYLLRFHGLCDFLVSRDLRSVQCRMESASERDYAPVLLSGTVIATILGLAGECVLHASVVEYGGSAIALAGPSGTGKSTLAALLCAAGARLVADDVLRIGFADGVRCVGRSSELRLRPSAAGVVGAFDTRPPQRKTADERIALRPDPSAVSCPPLSAIVLPTPVSGIDGVELDLVPGADALFELVGLQRVEGWKPANLQKRQFDQMHQLASEVPVLKARLAWDVPFSRLVAEQLFEAVASDRA